MAALPSREAEYLYDIARLQLEMMHGAEFKVLLLCNIDWVFHFIHQIVQVKRIIAIIFAELSISIRFVA